MELTTGKIDKWIITTGALLFLVAACLFAYTQNYIFIGIPFIPALLAITVYNWKLLFWLLIFATPLSCEISIFDGVLSTTIPDEQIMWLFVTILIFLIAAKGKYLLPGWFLAHPLTLIFFLQFLWMVVAVIFSTDLLPSLKFMAAKSWFWTSYIILPILVFKEKKDFRTAFFLFAVPTLLHAIVAFAWHYTEQFDYYKSNVVVTPFYFNHVDYSSVLSMLFPVFLIAFQLSKGKTALRVILGTAILFLIPAIYVAAARAAILGVFFALGVAFAIRIKKVNLILPTIFAIITLVVVFMVKDNNYIRFRPSMDKTATQDNLADAVSGMFTGKDMSSMERFYRWIAAARMSTEHPLVGVGPNNFYENYKPYTVTTFRTWVSRNPERSTTHNYFLFMLVEQGWPATILYAIMLLIFFATAQKVYHRTRDVFYKKVTMGLAMLVAAGFVNNFFSELLETHKIGALFYISMSLMIVLDYKSRQEATTAQG